MPVEVVADSADCRVSACPGDRRARCRRCCCRWRLAAVMPNASPWSRWRPGLASRSQSPPIFGSREQVLVYRIGGWAPPLGIALRADGLSAIMALTTALVICAIGLFARENFSVPAGAQEQRAPLVFWTLLMGVWAGLNAVWLGGGPVHPLCRAGAADLRRGSAGVAWTAARRRSQPRCATCCSRCSDRRCICLARRCSMAAMARSISSCWPAWFVAEPVVWIAVALDDSRSDRQDRVVPAASMAAAGPCRRTGRGQRAAVGAGGQGLVLADRPALVRHGAGTARPGGGPGARRTGRRGDRVRQRSGTSTGATEAADRLFDDRADRLPVLSLSACRRAVGSSPRGGTALERHRLDRRRAPACLPCRREGRHVHGSRVDRRGAGARPHSGLRRHRPGDADDSLRLRHSAGCH